MTESTAVVKAKELRRRAPVLGDTVPYPGRDLTSEELEKLKGLRVRLPNALAWLKGYALTGRKEKAAGLAGVSSSAHGYWLKTDPVFAEVYKDLVEEVRIVGNDMAMDRVEMGFADRMYNGDGELVGTRMRQDAGFTSKWLASIDPQWRSNEKNDEVVITIRRTEE